MRPARLLLFLALCVFGVAEARAQLSVQLKINRRTHMVYEPVLATVSITNMAGRQVVLEDSAASQWFSFQLMTGEGRSIPPRNPDYQLEPLTIGPGETAKRTVNLQELYQLGDFGTVKVRANIYMSEANRYFSSRPEVLEFTEGRKIWTQTVGVPEGQEGAGSIRRFTLLTLEQEKGKMLYVRIEGESDGNIYGCYNLGRLVHGIEPEMQFDLGNNLWVLQLVAQKTYFLSKIGPSGQFHAQSTYVTPKSKPYLRRLGDGTLQLVGAIRQPREIAGDPAAPKIPKLSDRPAGFPQ
jgi:hypothetical protein